MRERLDANSREVLVDARAEARAHDDATLEAEHLLLALARHSRSDAGTLLADVGLDHDRLRQALDAQSAATLASVGIPAALIDRQRSTFGPRGEPRWGASARRALERSLRVARRHRARTIRPTHLLLGVLGASEGTVPRTLAAAGVDIDALVGSAETSLADPRG